RRYWRGWAPHWLLMTLPMPWPAESVARAAARQFHGKHYRMLTFPHVTKVYQVDKIIEKSYKEVVPIIIVFTTVLEEVRNAIISACESFDIEYLDIMDQALQAFGRKLGAPPLYKAGLSRKLDHQYFSKIDAIEFTIRHDDGKSPEGIMKADLVLIGVSRTSKTPLSMYLAYLNYRVINVPIVQYIPVPEQIYKVSSSKIIGLTIEPKLLSQIRIERTRMMGYRHNDHYNNMVFILEELEFASKIMKRIGCPIIDVSNKAIEETANEILEIILHQ
ncbi:MAG: pyruvate, water dikinase regulatory protein, partial [Bacteroidota bacterium]